MAAETPPDAAAPELPPFHATNLRNRPSLPPHSDDPASGRPHIRVGASPPHPTSAHQRSPISRALFLPTPSAKLAEPTSSIDPYPTPSSSSPSRSAAKLTAMHTYGRFRTTYRRKIPIRLPHSRRLDSPPPCIIPPSSALPWPNCAIHPPTAVPRRRALRHGSTPQTLNPPSTGVRRHRASPLILHSAALHRSPTTRPTHSTTPTSPIAPPRIHHHHAISGHRRSTTPRPRSSPAIHNTDFAAMPPMSADHTLPCHLKAHRHNSDPPIPVSIDCGVGDVGWCELMLWYTCGSWWLCCCFAGVDAWSWVYVVTLERKNLGVKLWSIAMDHVGNELAKDLNVSLKIFERCLKHKEE